MARILDVEMSGEASISSRHIYSLHRRVKLHRVRRTHLGDKMEVKFLWVAIAMVDKFVNPISYFLVSLK